MKVTIEQHKKYLTTKIDLEKDFPKIIDWIDKEWRDIYLPWLDDKSKNRLTEDEVCWKWMVSMFKKIPDGKKTKAFVYQMMVLNDIVNDGVNGKKDCWIRHHKCEIEKRWLAKLGREWVETDLQNICGNLAICIRLPDPGLYPFNLEFPEKLKEIVIDDRILNIGR